MPFVNEYIPTEDVVKYGLKAIDAKFFPGTRARDWTIDRERDIYLRIIDRGGGPDPEGRSETTWTFYWKGTPLTLRLDLLATGGGRGEAGWSRWRMVWLNGSFGLPLTLRAKETEILTDLKSALLVYKDGGVYASKTDFHVELEFAAEYVL